MGNLCCNDRRGFSKDVDERELPRVTRNNVDQRIKTWSTTGVVGLRDGNLKELPKALTQVAANVRNLDAAHNQLAQVPDVVEGMTQLQRLVLSENRIAQFSISCALLTMLKVLVLDNNLLTQLPADIGGCVRLEKLSVARNGLTSLPPSVASLSKLKSLCVANNALSCLPSWLASCTALEVLEASSNRLDGIPSELSALCRLKTLDVSSNLVATVPTPILRDCVLLQTLLLHDNPISKEVLEETEGYAEFEARRRAKYNKSIAGGALINNSGLDAGVDIPT